MPISVIFFGTPEFAVPSLRVLCENPEVKVSLVVTQPDKPAGRGNKVRISAVKEFALAQGIPVLQPSKLKKELPEFLPAAARFGPFDVGVVIAFGQILPKEVLQFPRTGCLNIHASLLPRWRGAAPIQRAIMSGDTKTGVCVMQMDEGLDTGPVFTHSEVRIEKLETAQSLHDKLAIEGAGLLVQNLDRIISGEIKATPQKEEGLSYAQKIIPSESLISWDKPAIIIAQQIRGLSPFPGAYTLFRGQRLKILLAEEKSSIKNGAQARVGTVSIVDKNRCEVHCGQDDLSILEVQLEGRKRLAIGEFLRGVEIQHGEKLGE